MASTILHYVTLFLLLAQITHSSAPIPKTKNHTDLSTYIVHADHLAKNLMIQRQLEELGKLKAELSATKKKADLEVVVSAQPKVTKEDLEELELLRRDVPLLRDNLAKVTLEAEEKTKALSAAIQEKSSLQEDLEAAKADSQALLIEKEEVQSQCITLKAEHTSLLESARGVCQYVWPIPEEMPEGPLHSVLVQALEALRAHCKSVAEYASRHTLSVVKSLYPKVSLSACQMGFAKGTTVEQATQLMSEAISCGEELAKDVPLSP